MTDRRELPGPAGHWLLGNLGLLRRDILSLLEELPRQYGDVVRLRFGAYRALLLSHPSHVEQVLVTQGEKFEKPPRFRRIVRTVFGNGVFGAEGALALQQRGLLLSALATVDHQEHSRIVVACAERIVAGWRDEDDGDLASRMVDLALAIRAKTTLGIDGGSALSSIHTALGRYMEYYTACVQSPLTSPLWVPTVRNRRVKEALKEWRTSIDNLIRRANERTDTDSHLLGRLLARERSDGVSALSRRQLRDELTTWLLAGTETTANTLSWACYLLARHPDQQDRLFDVIQAAVRGRTVQRADLPLLPRLGWVIAESMRLYPQAYVIGRKSVEPFAIGGWNLPEKTTVILNQWSIGRDPRWYENPMSFDPDRWSGDLLSRAPAFSYFPFGGGGRACLGRTLATFELPLVLAAVVKQFRFALSSDADVRPCPSLTLRPLFGRRALVASRRQR